VRAKKDFFIPVKVLSALFKTKFIAYLRRAYKEDKLVFSGQIAPWEAASKFNIFTAQLRQKEWIAYCNPPFRSPKKVLEYLGRYIHRVAISNDRILKLEDDQVTFSYRDYKDKDKIKQITLHAFEFIRRFLFHILPDGFVKIRHYGILSNRNKETKLKQCRHLLGTSIRDDHQKDPQIGWEDLLYHLTGIDPRICPECKKGSMRSKEVLQPQTDRSPPVGEMMSA
jgi:hypothetical protein